MPRQKQLIETTKSIETSKGVVVIHKLALKEYIGLLKALKKLPKDIASMVGSREASDLSKPETLAEALPPIIADSLPEFCEILAIATDKDKDFFLECDLFDFINVLNEALKVNDYEKTVALVKKMMARKRPASA